MAGSKLAAIIEQLRLHKYFRPTSYAGEIGLIMRIEHMLPDADAIIKSLLPDVAWMDSSPRPAVASLACTAELSVKGKQVPTSAAAHPVPQQPVGMRQTLCTPPPGLDTTHDLGVQSDSKGSTLSSSMVSSQLQAIACFCASSHITAFTYNVTSHCAWQLDICRSKTCSMLC